MTASSLSLPTKSLPIIFLPALFALGLILHFAVDVPFWDEWEIPLGLYSKIIEGDFNYYDHLFSQHIDSIEPFPRLFFLAGGLAFGWHGPHYMVLSWACTLMTLFILLKLLLLCRGQISIGFLYIAGLLSAMVFSISQWENWLWGVELIVFIPPLCLSGCLWVQSTRASFSHVVRISALLSCIATFSYPNGISCWLLGFPLLKVLAIDWKTVSTRERREVISGTALYVISAVVTVSFYLWNYTRPEGTHSFGAILEDPLLGLQYYLAWIGSSLIPQPYNDLAIQVGAGLVLAVVFSLILVMWKWNLSFDMAVFTSCYPWICLMAYGLVTGLVTTAGRVGRGLPQALAPRYISFSLWVAVGLVGLLYALKYGQGRKPTRVINISFVLLTGIIAVLTIGYWMTGMKEMQQANLKFQQNLLTVRLLDVAPSNPLMSRAHWDPVGASTRGRQLMKHGILPIEPIGPWLLEKLNDPDGQAAGSFFILTEKRKNVVTGWTKLPPHELPADCVILARKLPTGQPAVITGFITAIQDSDGELVGSRLQAPVSEFHETFDFPYTQGDQWAMFAVNLQTQRVYELKDDLTRSRVLSYSFLSHIENAERLSPEPDFIGVSAFVLQNQDRMVLFEHPNSEIIFTGVPIAQETQLEFGLGINEPAWEQSGDGVLFEVFLQDENGKEYPLFSQWVDPKNNPEDRRWLDQRIDLEAFAGETVSFQFKTSGGPDNDLAYDWAGWSTPRIIVNPARRSLTSSL